MSLADDLRADEERSLRRFFHLTGNVEANIRRMYPDADLTLGIFEIRPSPSTAAQSFSEAACQAQPLNQHPQSAEEPDR